MKIVVCVKPSVTGEIGAFEAAAYEAALRIEGAEITLLSMAPEKSKDLLLRLTRLGAKEAVLLCDRHFAGADTLATGYALSLAIDKIKPDLVLCGRQTMEGDTAQVGIGLATYLNYSLATRVMSLSASDSGVSVTTRSGVEKTLPYPCVLTLERIHELRLPSIRSKPTTVRVLSATDIGADVSRCGLQGSPTKVVKTFENQSGKRRAKEVSKDDFDKVLRECLNTPSKNEIKAEKSATPLKNLWVFGEAAKMIAETVSDDVKVFSLDYTADEIVEMITKNSPSAVLWDSSDKGKLLASTVAVKLKTGLCADCTLLETDGEDLFMYRPAFSGNVIAKIRCVTKPIMATVRTKTESANVIFGIGAGAVQYKAEIIALAQKYGADIAASRAVVDSGDMKYETQVGLTGKTVAPRVYVAFGISGAVHHIAGIQSSGDIIAVNFDKDAEIFDYSDYKIICDLKDFF